MEADSVIEGRSPLGQDREFDFTTRDFDRIRRLIYDKAGISLAPSKAQMAYSRLTKRLRAHGLARFSDYLALLDAGDAGEWEAFTNALTTNLTSFFREPHHFAIFSDYLKRGGDRAHRVWCSASSTGEEPYSIAMTACEAFDDEQPPVEIVASDIDTGVLESAARGVYSLERTDKLSPQRLKRFFRRGVGPNDGLARVRPALRQMIEFKRVNLLEAAWPVKGPFSAIFCRNVMIYFDKPTQAKILRRFAPLLEPDGLLFVGHSESLQHVSDLFRLSGKTVYALTQDAKRLAAK